MSESTLATPAAADLLYASSTLVTPRSPRRRLRIWGIAVTAITVMLLTASVIPAASQWFTHGAIGFSPLVLLGIFFAALICEYVDSSLGMGYGTALTPLLLFCGFAPLDIVPCILLSEFLTGLSAGLLHHHDGNIDLLRDRRVRSTAILLGALSGIGAVAAVFVALAISKFWLTASIGTIILVMGLLILITLRRPFRYRPGHLIGVGAVAAFNKGLSGGGYGPLVTAGQVVAGISPKQAVGITSLAESATCLVGLVMYFCLHNSLDWSLALPLTTGALLSVPIATLSVRWLPEQVMRSAVGVGTIFLGVLTLFKLLVH